MKKSLLGLTTLVLLAIGVIFLILARTSSPTANGVTAKTPPTTPSVNPIAQTAPTNVPAITPSNNSAVAVATVPPTNLAVTAGVIAAATDSAPPIDLPPKTVMANVRTAIRQYNQMWGGNPVGTNPEIIAALSGNNPKHINFINTEAGMRVNDQGQMIDVWGTPYFFHQLSGTDTEIHSAGPDKVMWTSDDLVVK